MKIVEIIDLMNWNWFCGGFSISFKNVNIVLSVKRLCRLRTRFFNEIEFESRSGAFCKFLKVVGWPICADFKLFFYL
jgi:hypothetical protein